MRVFMVIFILSLPMLAGVLSVATTEDPHGPPPVQLADQR